MNVPVIKERLRFTELIKAGVPRLRPDFESVIYSQFRSGYSGDGFKCDDLGSVYSMDILTSL